MEKPFKPRKARSKNNAHVREEEQKGEQASAPSEATQELPAVNGDAPEEHNPAAKRRERRAAAGQQVATAAEPSQVSALPNSLELLNGPNDGALHSLEAPFIVIGRDPDPNLADPRLKLSEEGQKQLVPLMIVPEDPKVSRLHVLLFQKEGRWWVRDLESTNGTLLGINRRRLERGAEQVIEPGERITIGDTSFRLIVAPPTATPND